jgi:hypothetical protein
MERQAGIADVPQRLARGVVYAYRQGPPGQTAVLLPSRIAGIRQ